MGNRKHDPISVTVWHPSCRQSKRDRDEDRVSSPYVGHIPSGVSDNQRIRLALENYQLRRLLCGPGQAYISTLVCACGLLLLRRITPLTRRTVASFAPALIYPGVGQMRNQFVIAPPAAPAKFVRVLSPTAPTPNDGYRSTAEKHGNFPGEKPTINSSRLCFRMACKRNWNKRNCASRNGGVTLFNGALPSSPAHPQLRRSGRKGPSCLLDCPACSLAAY